MILRKKFCLLFFNSFLKIELNCYKENRLFIKPGIQERGTECGECGEWAFRRTLKKIPGNAQQDSGEWSRRFRGMLNKIPGNAQQDSGECSKRFRECSKRFRGMFQKIPGNAQEDSGECSKRFRGILEKILVL